MKPAPAFFLLLILFAACGTKNQTGPWIGPFVKVDSVNPIMKPGHGKFRCPVRQTVIPWENKDVFNPSAVIREGKVHLIYRAEDTIGMYKGTSRLGLAVSSDGLRQGGSTITMQLVKNLYDPNAPRDFTQKIKEAHLARQVEQRYTKDQILTKYLNGVF